MGLGNYAQDQSRQCLPGIGAVASDWKRLYNGVTSPWESFSNYPALTLSLAENSPVACARSDSVKIAGT